jgi:hypothetical protein
MNRTLLAAAAFGALAIAAPALAQPAAWQNIDGRQAQLDQRIDVGVRNGSLTRDEAVRLRGEFRMIADLERNYRANGLTMSERNDLDRRFDLLSARIQYERADNQDNRGPGSDRGPGYNNGNGRNDNNGRGPGYNNGNARNDNNRGASINARQAVLERRIEMGLRNRSLTRAEGVRLRTEFRTIANLEARYRVNGLNDAERRDLDRRFDVLQAHLRTELADNNFRWDNFRYR